VSTGGGAPACATAANNAAAPFATIQSALSCAAADGTTPSSPDTIDVAAGTYAEHLSVAANVNLVGAGASTTFLDGTHSGVVVTVPSADRVGASSLTIENGAGTLFGGGVHDEGAFPGLPGRSAPARGAARRASRSP
jgi:pectin methylesterase-like acyl-CoA thioesterase